MNIKDIIKNNSVRFLYYRKGELWYEVYETRLPDGYGKSILTFPVPISDCGDGTFKAQDKAIIFMRYIRKQLESLKKDGLI